MGMLWKIQKICSTMTTPRSCIPTLALSCSSLKLALGANTKQPTSPIAAGGTLAWLRRARVTTTPGSCNLTSALSVGSSTQAPGTNGQLQAERTR